nr:nematode resistance protein-like HSPRO2 [Ipomoea batatas]
MLCEDEAEDGVTRGAAPIVDLTSSDGTLARRNSSAKVWKLSDEVTVVSRTSEASLLPRLVTWRKSEDIAQNILDFIESEMRKCPIGLGEANLNDPRIVDLRVQINPKPNSGANRIKILRKRHERLLDTGENLESVNRNRKPPSLNGSRRLPPLGCGEDVLSGAWMRAFLYSK